MATVGRLDAGARALEVRRVLRRILYLNVAVVGVKLAAYLSSNALSILAEVGHSTLDASNNVLALWIARVASRAPDAEHPYGHQKFETLGALILVGFLSITVFELVQHALLRMSAPTPPRIAATPLSLAAMLASVAVGIAVAGYESRRGKALGSDILLADAAHTRSDIWTTLAVLGGLLAIRLGHPGADPILAIIVAAIIAWTGWSIVRESVPVLVDERAVEPERIQRVAEALPEVRSCYGIRSRGRPGEVFAELTIAVDPDLDVLRSHGIADDVERRVAGEVGAREVVVHVEPARWGDP